jgi:hypothetical protein
VKLDCIACQKRLANSNSYHHVMMVTQMCLARPASFVASKFAFSSSFEKTTTTHNPHPNQSPSILHPLSQKTTSKNHRVLHPTSTAATLLPFFESRFAKHSLIPPRHTRDTAHQIQSQLAFLSIEYRITNDCYRSFFCLVLLILTVRSTTSFSPSHKLHIHNQDVCQTRQVPR